MSFDEKVSWCSAKGGERRVGVRCGMGRGECKSEQKQVLTFLLRVARPPEV